MAAILSVMQALPLPLLVCAATSLALAAPPPSLASDNSSLIDAAGKVIARFPVSAVPQAAGLAAVPVAHQLLIPVADGKIDKQGSPVNPYPLLGGAERP